MDSSSPMPLTEPCRIMANICERMAWVDALAQQPATARATAETLPSNLVAELTSASANGAPQASPGQRPGKTSAKPMKG
jgi:hypothetical protein